MTDQRFPAINLTGRPSAVASVPGLSTNFAGVATIASGTAAVTVTGVEIGSDTAVFLGSMTHSYTAVTSGFTSRALTVASLTTTPGSGAFNIITMDGLAVNSAAAVRVPCLIWNIR
jgi:hypothetical protein